MLSCLSGGIYIMSNEQMRRINSLLEKEEVSSGTINFIQSLKEQLTKKGALSEKQWSAFQKAEYRYSDEAIAIRKSWMDNWDKEKERKAKIAAEYYSHNPPYFRELSRAILGDEEYIPTEKEYRKLVENKYAQSVLSMVEAEPLYPVGSLVKMRSNHAVPRSLHDREAIVVSNDGPIKSAAKGSKLYKVLPFGHSNTIEVKESQLKKKR